MQQAHASLNRLALAATWHCLTGCAIGEVLGLVIATALDWGGFASIALAVVLAFFFGYSLTLTRLAWAFARSESAPVAERAPGLRRAA